MTERVRLKVEMEEVLIAGAQRKRRAARPEPEWLRGICPACGGDLVSNAYRVSRPGGNGYYLIRMECWEGLGVKPTCDYRRVI